MEKSRRAYDIGRLFHAGLSSSQGPALKVSVEKSAVAGVGAGSTFPHDLAFLSHSFCFSIHLLCPVCSVF